MNGLDVLSLPLFVLCHLEESLFLMTVGSLGGPCALYIQPHSH